LKALLLIVGILVATAGGVITYRALYVDPKSGVVITDTAGRPWRQGATLGPQFNHSGGHTVAQPL